MVWDLQPTLNISSGVPYPENPSQNSSSPADPRPQPTAYVIPFPHPLITVNSHPGSSKEFLVADSRGSIFLTDWRTDPALTEQGSWRHATLLELIEPHAVGDSLLGASSQIMGFAAWRHDNADMYVHDSRHTYCKCDKVALVWEPAMGHVSLSGTCQNYGAASPYTREVVSRTGGIFSGLFLHICSNARRMFTTVVSQVVSNKHRLFCNCRSLRQEGGSSSCSQYWICACTTQCHQCSSPPTPYPRFRFHGTARPTIACCRFWSTSSSIFHWRRVVEHDDRQKYKTCFITSCTPHEQTKQRSKCKDKTRRTVSGAQPRDH